MESVGLIVSEVARLLRRRFDEKARTIGVTRPQWQMLTALSRNEGINQGGLADLLEVEPITLCRMIDRLADAELVERRRDPADRRAWNIYLTAKSRPLLDGLSTISQDLMAATLDGLGAEGEALLAAGLARMRLNLQRIDNGSRAHG